MKAIIYLQTHEVAICLLHNETRDVTRYIRIQFSSEQNTNIYTFPVMFLKIN